MSRRIGNRHSTAHKLGRDRAELLLADTAGVEWLAAWGIRPEAVEDFGPGNGCCWRLGQPSSARATAIAATMLKSALMARYPLAIAVGNVSMTIPLRAYANR